jgi:hypothetical protein
MLNQCIAVTVMCALLQITALPGLAFSQAESDADLAQKVQRGIFELGIGPKALVRVMLKDQTKLSGYVSEAGVDTFTVTDPKTGAVVPVAYTDVSTLRGRGLSTGAKIAIGIAVGVGAFFLIAYALFLNWSS